MDIKKVESLNKIPLTVRVRKLKWPIVMLLNEFEKDEDIEFDVFQSSSSDIIRMVELPEDLVDLHACLQDMIQVVKITSLNYEIGCDALRLAVHLFYRIVLREKIYGYHNFVLYYEQYNKPWTLFSEEYHRTLKHLKTVDKLDQQRVKISSEKNKFFEDCTSFDDISVSNGIHEDLISSLSNLKLRHEEDHLPYTPLSFLKNQRCVYILGGCIEECAHSKLVVYQLLLAGDYFLVSVNKEEDDIKCPCKTMKNEIVRIIHPSFIDLVWGTRRLSRFKFWCYINCLITSKSFEMLKTVQPWMEGVKPGILAPITFPQDYKRLSLKTAALKILICDYLNIS